MSLLPRLRPHRSGTAAVLLPIRPAELTVPVFRPAVLLRDSGFEVHVVTRAAAGERGVVDGATLWVETSTGEVARRLLALRPELLFVESSTYGTVLGELAAHSWIRNPQPAARSRVRQLQRLALRSFDAVSFTNPAERRPWKVAPRQEADLPYPVEVKWWGEPVARRDSWWTERGWPVPEGPVMVCNSAFERRKGHAELLDWLAPFLRSEPSAVLVLFGHRWREPDVWEMVNTRPAELGVGPQVRTLDWISYEDIRALLAWTSLSIINTKRETQCMAIYEALAAGVPTLIRDIPDLTTQFPKLPAHSCGEELRANVRRVLSEEAFARGLVESSRDRVAWADVERHDEGFQATLSRLVGSA